MAIEVANLSAGYRQRTVLKEINARFPKGNITAIIGPNGSGKSTFLRVLARRLPLSSGSVKLNGINIDRYSALEFARHVAFLPQTPGNGVGYTVEELVGFGRFPHRSGKLINKRIVTKALERTGLLELRNRKMREISGGEQQRAWLAMVLAQQPEFLLLDEPSTFLDLRHQLEIMELLKTLNHELQITVIMVLHDPQLAALFSQRIMVIAKGEVVASGAPETVLTPELFAGIFGVSANINKNADGLFCFTATGLR